MTRTASKFLWAFGITSVFTTGLGAMTMAQAGLPTGLALRNLMAWGVGAGLALLIARFPPPRQAVFGVAIVLLAATFVMPGQDNVHRWIGLGPLQVNIAALVLPGAIACLRSDWISAIAGIGITALLIFQPDASQATAFTAAMATLSLATTRKWWRFLYILPFGIALQIWTHKQGFLPPVAHVEGIIDMAKVQAPVMAMGIVVMLTATALLPIESFRTSEKRYSALALSFYFALSAAAVVTGYFPVPLAGYGISFVIGWWLGAGMLASGFTDTKVDQKAIET